MRLSRLFAAVIVMIALVGTGGASPVGADSKADPSGRGAFASLPAATRERMLAQAPLVAAADAIAQAVDGGAGNGFTGIALGHQAVDLWWKGPVPASMREALDAARSIAPVNVKRAHHSLAELRAAAKLVLASARATPNGAVHGASIPVDGSRLVVEIDAAPATARAGLPALGVAFGLVSTPRARPAAGRWDDSPPFWGGAGMVNADNRKRCSSGFGVYDRWGNNFLLTAGHCGRPGGYWTTGSGDYSLGSAWYENVAHDLLLLGAGSTDGFVFTGDNDDPYAIPVAGWGQVYHNEFVCTSGAFSHLSCGARTGYTDHFYCGTDVYGNWECYEGLVLTYTGDRPVQQGDSGGPVFSFAADGRAIAKGIISGVRNDGSAFSFQDFATVRQDFDVWPIPAY